MANIQPYKKPRLVQLEEKTKIGQYPEERRNGEIKELVGELLSLLGVSDRADLKHHVQGAKFISDSCQNYSFEEVREAFKLYVGQTFEITVTQQFNAVVVGRVMREFEKYKKEQLAEYRRAQAKLRNEEYNPTKAEKERLMLDAFDRAKQELKDTGKFEWSKWHLYDWLIETERMPEPSEEYRRAAYKIAMKSEVDSLERKLKNCRYYERKQLKAKIEALKKSPEKQGFVVQAAKSEIVKEFILQEIKRNT